jgi:hypothetical protein
MRSALSRRHDLGDQGVRLRRPVHRVEVVRLVLEVELPTVDLCASLLRRRLCVRRCVSGLGGGFAWFDESAFVGEDDGLGTVVEVELGEDACDVRFDGGVADDELAGDLCV